MSTQHKLDQTRGVPGWLELYDLSLHTDTEAQAPKGAYIRGRIGTEQKFIPELAVLGRAIQPEGRCVYSGWLELETLRFHDDIEAVAPIPPYIQIRWNEVGRFYPREPYEIVTA